MSFNSLKDLRIGSLAAKLSEKEKRKQREARKERMKALRFKKCA